MERFSRSLQLLRVARDPAHRHEADRLDLAVHVVFLLQPGLDHLELQRADHAEDRLAPAVHREHHLDEPFFLELHDAGVELLRAGVEQPDAPEVLGREARHRRILHRRAGVERVADGELAGVGQADDVPGIGALDRLALAAEEAVGAGGAHHLALAGVDQRHVLVEHARADPHEGDAIPVLAVHVRLDLEHEPRHPGRHRMHHAPALGLARLRRRGQRLERVEDGLEAEVVERAAEEHRRLPPGQVLGLVERRPGPGDEIGVVDQRRVQLRPQQLDELRIGRVGGVHRRPVAAARHLLVEPRLLGHQVEDAAEAIAAADRPVQRGGVDAEHVLDLLQQLERVAAGQVQLVDEGDERQVAQAGHLEQLAGLGLDALGGVDHHHRAVHRVERPVGVLAEVLVARACRAG